MPHRNMWEIWEQINGHGDSRLLAAFVSSAEAEFYFLDMLEKNNNLLKADRKKYRLVNPDDQTVYLKFHTKSPIRSTPKVPS